MKKIILLSLLTIFLSGCAHITPTKPIDTKSRELDKQVEQVINILPAEESQKDYPPPPNLQESKTTPSPDETPYTSETKPTTTKEIIEKKAGDIITLVVEGKTYVNPYTKDISVYQFMQNLTTQSAQLFSFKAKKYLSLGYFIEEINGVKNNNKKGLYWIYYINGEPAKIGVSNYIIQPEDIIEWKYENTNL